MKILSAESFRAWEQFTIDQEPVSSIDLMERAARACTNWLLSNVKSAASFSIFCGKGNNGGDGLAIARMLNEKKINVTVYILEFGHKGTNDFQVNLSRLHQLNHVAIHFVQSEIHFPKFSQNEIIIDALFGSGLNRSPEGITARLIEHINNSGRIIISIDIPSGMFVDRSSTGSSTINANYTLSFQNYKPAFLLAENGEALGEIQLLDIGLHPAFYETVNSTFELVNLDLVKSIRKPRNRFAHKGNFGHSLLVAGSFGKIGAAVLASRACLRSGSGLLTCHIPKCGYEIMQTTVPEAMIATDFNSSFLTKIDTDLTLFDAIGIGPGIGNASETKMMLREILDAYRNPLVLDADALNIIAAQKDLLQLVPKGSILTPHPKEFERLFGKSENDFGRISLALEQARILNSIIVLKGHHTFIATPDGKGFFNNSGNPGMATAGSGDVLTGILTGLLAQGYSSIEAAIFGVYLHGLAGDLASKEQSMEAMTSGDIIEQLGPSFNLITT